ncbi:MAG: uroporphyrinogen-III C-methyltransferase, partial [Pseudomonadota bacterium]|nr:uroporphyrinogen-III C-methyltransferase [Pseudomonadota bacterium]
LAQAEFAIAMTQARSAVLARDTEGFRLQLQNLHDWHTKYTDADSAATATNLVAIRALSERDLAPAPFDLTEALKLLDQLLDGPI